MWNMLPFFDESEEFLNSWTFGVLVVLVVYFAWRSTYVREDRPSSQAAVLVIENNLRRLNRITQQPVTINILRSSSQQSNISNVTETEELDLENDSIASSIDNITQSILTEASESATGLDISDSETTYPSTSAVVAGSGGGRSSLDEVDLGPEEIIRQMDRDLDDVPAASTSGSAQSSSEPVSDGMRDRRSSQTAPKEGPDGPASVGSETAKPQEQTQSKQIRIKLKYLNDDSKLVEGNLNEGIGEFKKRNFSIELAAEKLVRLVFNGHVLQPDSKTLAACGLFDNCVVHCLIHNPKPQTGAAGEGGNGTGSVGENGATDGSGGFGAAAGLAGGSMGSDNSTRYGTYFIYIGTFLFSTAIAYCWYCRFHYGHLFNLNSTIGLIVTTTIFLIMMPTIILTDSNSAN